MIPLFNCLDLTKGCVASLQASLPPGLSHEIILVDDGSTDGTRHWLATLGAPFRVILNERNLGYAVSNNRGAQLARGEYLALLNNDLILQPGWLQPMLAVFRHEALAGVVGNIQLDAKTGAVDHAGIVLTLKGKPEHARTLPPWWSRALRGARRVPAVTGACLILERTFWHELGGFDDSFMNGGEDVDLCFRARAAGLETYVALGSVVRHHVSSSTGRKLRDEENSYRLTLRHHRAFIAETTRAWCWEFLGPLMERSDPREYPLVIHTLLHAAGIIPTPPPEAVAGMDHALAREFARWREMFPQGLK